MTEPTIANIALEEVDLVALMEKAMMKIKSNEKMAWYMNRTMVVIIYWMGILDSTAGDSGFELEPINFDNEAMYGALTYKDAE